MMMMMKCFCEKIIGEKCAKLHFHFHFILGGLYLLGGTWYILGYKL